MRAADSTAAPGRAYNPSAEEGGRRSRSLGGETVAGMAPVAAGAAQECGDRREVGVL